MKTLRQKMTISFIAMTMALLGSVTILSSTTNAIDPASEIGDAVGTAGGNGGSGNQSISVQIKRVVNALLFVLGAIAVVMIIIGGIRYTLSNGDQTQITAAKNTILYSVIGLVVAILAFAIVNFVVDAFSSGGGGGGGGSGRSGRGRD